MNKFKSFIFSSMLLCFSLVTSEVIAASSNDIERDLLNKISKAQSELTQTELSIAKSKSRLTKSMTDLEHALISLEKKTLSARKIADEKNLNLSQLQERLKTWQSQQSYQQNLLQQFLRLHSEQHDANLTTAQKLGVVAEITDQIELWFEPAFITKQLVVESGKIENAELISYGPVHWMINNGQGYRAEMLDDEWVVQQRLSESMSNALLELKQGNTVQLSFDPSLSKLTQVPHESILDHVHKGGVWIVPILTFALVALVIAIVRGFVLWRLPKIQLFSQTGLDAVVKGESVQPMMGKMQNALLTLAMSSHSEQERDDLLFQQLQQDKVTLEKRLTAIAITASVAPLLGLLGTVSGMIETFRMMTLFGSGDPEVVSGGIAQALITTEMGLVVAIPALIIHAILSRKAKAYHNQLENFALMLTQTDVQFKHKSAA